MVHEPTDNGRDEPQKLEFQNVEYVQTFFEVHGGGPTTQRVVRVIAPAVHFLIRCLLFLAGARPGRVRPRPHNDR
jgi:hypothetical protein